MSVSSKRGRPFKDAESNIRRNMRIKISDKMYEDLCEYSQNHDISIAEIIRRAVRAFLENK